MIYAAIGKIRKLKNVTKKKEFHNCTA
jgi:hypothetical protein